MIRLLNASRATFVRAVQKPSAVSSRAFITPTSVLRVDIVQDLYIKELRGYKPAATKPSDSEGHVQKFSPPKAPQSPETGDIASELQAYESQQVEVEGQTAAEDSGASDEDWLEHDEEETARTSH